ncbi:MAG: MmcQ/YjbR family DNA-binding protein [Proteobacteria bacterium]|nr:MmcQ/YjbR family DNA-binding protein [Pseudomonadota bacterium]
MATAKDLRRIALSLAGTTEAPHFARAAFKVAKIYATLAPDGLTANLKFAPDEQELKCLLVPEAFAPVSNPPIIFTATLMASLHHWRTKSTLA